MRNPRLDYNEIVQYIGDDIMYEGNTILKSGDNVHIERQYTAEKIVIFQVKNNGLTFTLKIRRELFKTLPGRPCKKPFRNAEENEILNNIQIANLDVRYVVGRMLS
jgi:hypothetical protein